jgi:hypothetical protein
MFKFLNKTFCKKAIDLATFKAAKPNEIIPILNSLRDDTFDNSKRIEILNKYEINGLKSAKNIIIENFTDPDSKYLINPKIAKIDENLIPDIIENAFNKAKAQSEWSAKRLFKEVKMEEIGEEAHHQELNPFKKFQGQKPEKSKRDNIEETYKQFDKHMEKLKSKAFIEDSFFDFDVLESKKLTDDSFLNAEYNSDDVEVKVNVKEIIKETNQAVNQILDETPDLPVFEASSEFIDTNTAISGEFSKYLNNLKTKDNNFVQTKAKLFPVLDFNIRIKISVNYSKNFTSKTTQLASQAY